MRDTVVIASRVGLTALVFAAVVISACAKVSQSTPSGDANGDGQKGKGEQSNTVRQEPTVKQGERQVLTGIITHEGRSSSPKGPRSRILVEKSPDADRGGGRGSLASGCEKMYFDITGKTDVFRKEGNTRRAIASAADLQKGLRVSVDYTGYAVMESYPSQTGARVVTILESP